MNKTNLIFGIFALIIIRLISCNDNQQNNVVEKPTTQTEIKILLAWQGDYPVSELNLIPEDQREQSVGFIGDSEIFSSIWNQFKPGKETPEINFNTNLVLFARNIQYYNRISIGKVTLSNGVVDVLAMETMSAIPIEEKVALSLAVVPRQGITAIKIGDKEMVIK